VSAGEVLAAFLGAPTAAGLAMVLRAELRDRRRDAARRRVLAQFAAAYASEEEPVPPDGGEPAPAEEDLAGEHLAVVVELRRWAA
jgi:hypothetical protein